MRAAAVALVAVLGGCALTPAEVRERGERITTNHTTNPETTARCIVEHLDATAPSNLGRSRAIPNSAGAFEVVVRLLGEFPDTAAVATLTPSGQGSTGEWYVNHNIILYPRAAGIVERFKGRC